MSFDFGISLEQEPVDWDQFLINADLQQQEPDSPAPCDSQADTPKSTESEQSELLDVSAPDPDFDFEFNFGFDIKHSGIAHRPEDIFNTLPAYTPAVPQKALVEDPTISSTFTDMGAFGEFTGLGDNAATQLGLTDLLNKLAATVDAAPQPAVQDTALSQAYAALGWTPPTVEPSSLTISPRPDLKRKDSVSSIDTSAPAKRPRGRPPKSRSPDAVGAPAPVKRVYRRQSKGEGSPLSRSVTFADEDADSEPDSPKVTISGKPSTARPKSVVPEKYLKDGSAQSILGMTIEEISNFPTFDDLLKKVDPAKQAAAAAFGARISENRDKAKDAAKKSREERKAKIDSLEQTVADLEGKVEGLQGVLLSLVARGLISQGEVAAHLV